MDEFKWEKNGPNPPCVQFKNGAWYLVKRSKWTWLGRSFEAAHPEWLRLTRAPVKGMPLLIDSALEALRPHIKATTHKQYVTAARHIKTAFEQFQPEQVEPSDVYDFLAMMDDRRPMANRCLAVLRKMFEYAHRNKIVKTIPTLGIKLHKTPKRERLLTPQEYHAIYSHAPERLQVIMDLCYLTGQRISDVLNIHRSQIQDGKIEFRQQKTGKRLIVDAPGLAAVIERAKGLHGNVKGLTLLHRRKGKPPSYTGVRDLWKASCARAGVEDATLHDIRAMSLTHAKAQGLDATALAGHSSEAMTARYLRSKEVPTVHGPSMNRKSL